MFHVLEKVIDRIAVRVLLAALILAPAAHAQDDLTGFTGTVNLQGAIDGANACEIRVYSNGGLVHEAASDATGRFDFRFDVSGSVDETLVVWFLPDSDERVPELLLLKESSNARRNAVWSPCVPREKPTDVVLYDVTFREEKELLDSLAESDCFEQG